MLRYCDVLSYEPDTRSFDHQHRALRELHDSICTAADHSLVERGMACGPDDQQIGLDVGRELDDVPHGVPRQDMGMKLHLALFRHAARALEHPMKIARRRPGSLPNLLYEFRNPAYSVPRGFARSGVMTACSTAASCGSGFGNRWRGR